MDDATSALQRGVVQRGVGIPAAEYCPALTSLYVYGCDKLTDASIMAIAGHCSALTSLNVSSCHKLTDASITAIYCGAQHRTHEPQRGRLRQADGCLDHGHQGAPRCTHDQ